MRQQPRCQLAFSWDFVALHGRLTLHGDSREHSAQLRSRSSVRCRRTVLALMPILSESHPPESTSDNADYRTNGNRFSRVKSLAHAHEGPRIREPLRGECFGHDV